MPAGVEASWFRRGTASTGPAGVLWPPVFTVYDSFGNRMPPLPPGEGQGEGLTGAGSYAWRGGEGSVTDSEPNLIHMQARHYDPTLGRFIQADTLMLASFTTQGMNKYIYTENDPVNMSDPTGMKFSGWGMLYFTVMVGVIVATIWSANPMVFAGAVFGAINAMMAALFYQIGMHRCVFSLSDINWDDVAFAGMMGAAAGAIGGLGVPLLGPPIAGYVGQLLLTNFLNRLAWSATTAGYLWGVGGFLRSWE